MARCGLRLLGGPALAAVAAAAALAWCEAAEAHVVPDPQVLPSGEVTAMRLAVPNERPEPMSAFEATVPAGFRIVDARSVAGWTVEVDDATARWRGGPLAHLAIETFVLEVEVSAGRGTATLDTRQLYPSGAQVTWPAELTVVRGAAATAREPAQRVWVLAILGVVAASLALGVAVVARQRSRVRTLRA